MAESKFIETSLNPFLESLVKYVAENFTQHPGNNTIWYKIMPQYSDSKMTAYGNDTFSHKDVVENWVANKAKDIIEDRLKPKEPVAVGTLNTPFGLKGFETAGVGTTVYDNGDRYIIKLSNKDTVLEVPFYKKTLEPNIDFYIA